jgi:hypothetical protein
VADDGNELQPDSLMGWWPLGVSLWGLGRFDESVTVCERAVMLPRAPNYVGHLGAAYARVGRTAISVVGRSLQAIDHQHIPVGF